MRALLKRIQSPFKENNKNAGAIIALGSGQVLAQVAQLLFIPLLTRFYTPGQYGEFALFVLAATAGTAFCSWRYEQAIILTKDDSGASNLFVMVVGLSLISALFYVVGLNWVREPLSAFFGYGLSFQMVACFVTAVLLQSCYITIGYWLLRTRSFKIEARARIVLAIGVGGGQLLAPFLPLEGNGLVTGYIAGHLVVVSGLACCIVSYCRPATVNLNLHTMARLAKRYRRFPLISTWEVFANKGALLLPLAFLTHFFGSTVTGLFSLARNVYNLPLSCISEPSSRVFLVKAREMADNPEEVIRSCRIWLYRLAVLGVLLLGTMALLLPSLFGIVFGEHWIEAGPYMVALLPISFARFAAVPIMPVLIVYELHKLNLMWQVSFAVSVLFSYFVFCQFFSPLWAVTAAGFVGAIWYAFIVALLLKGICLRRSSPILSTGRQ